MVNFRNFYKKNKTPIIIIFSLVTVYLVERYNWFPKYNMNAIYLFMLVGFGYYCGTDYTNEWKMKFTNTPLVVTENWFNTCTKVETSGNWLILFTGGLNSNQPLLNSYDGDEVIVVEKQYVKKVGRVYQIQSFVSHCTNGYMGLPPDVQNTIKKNNWEAKSFALSLGKANSLEDEDGDEVSNDMYQGVMFENAMLKQTIIEKLGSFEKFIHGYAGVRENLDRDKPLKQVSE
jgi:hypothetical protein